MRDVSKTISDFEDDESYRGTRTRKTEGSSRFEMKKRAEGTPSPNHEKDKRVGLDVLESENRM